MLRINEPMFSINHRERDDVQSQMVLYVIGHDGLEVRVTHLAVCLVAGTRLSANEQLVEITRDIRDDLPCWILLQVL